MFLRNKSIDIDNGTDFAHDPIRVHTGSDAPNLHLQGLLSSYGSYALLFLRFRFAKEGEVPLLICPSLTTQRSEQAIGPYPERASRPLVYPMANRPERARTGHRTLFWGLVSLVCPNYVLRHCSREAGSLRNLLFLTDNKLIRT